MASSVSHRQIVASETEATISRRRTSCRIVGDVQAREWEPERRRELAGDRPDFNDHLSGKDSRPTPPRPFMKPLQAFLEEPLAPLRHDLPSGVETSGDLVVVQSFRGHQHDLGSHHVSIRQRIPARSGFQLVALLGAHTQHVRALPGHGDPLSGGTIR